MAWTKGTCTGADAFLARIKDFATRTKFAAAAVAGSNTGDGIVFGVSATENASAETFTLTCTDVGSGGIATFSVSSPATSGLADAIVNTPYGNDYVSFTLIAGATDFIVGDSFTFAVSTDTALWIIKRDDTASDDHELILQGEGSSGSEELLIGIQSKGTNVPYLKLQGFNGFDSGAAFDEQQGAILEDRFVPLITSLIEYTIWDFKDGIRFVAICGSTVYEHGYLGWPVRLASPSQWNNPMVVGGCCRDGNYANTTEPQHHAYWRCYAQSVTYNYVSGLNGETWIPTGDTNDQIYTSPSGADGGYSNNPNKRYVMAEIYRDANGNVPLFPATLILHDLGIVFGHFVGTYHVASEEGYVSADDVIIQSGAAFTCYQDAHQAEFICAMTME